MWFPFKNRQKVTKLDCGCELYVSDTSQVEHQAQVKSFCADHAMKMAMHMAMQNRHLGQHEGMAQGYQRCTHDVEEMLRDAAKHFVGHMDGQLDDSSFWAGGARALSDIADRISMGNVVANQLREIEHQVIMHPYDDGDDD